MSEEKPDSTSLVSLVQQSNAIMSMIAANGGELTPELEQALTNVDLAVAEKIDAYDVIMGRLEVEAGYWKAEAARRAALAKGCENAVKRLHGALKTAMLAKGVDEVQGTEVRFVLSDAAKRLIINTDALPGTWLRQEIDFVPDKERIKAALEAGEVIPGAALEGGKSLRSYSNTTATKKKKGKKDDSNKE